MPELYIGLMSGTSLDGVDAVLVDFAPAAPRRLQVLGHQALPFERGLRNELMALNRSGPDELHRAALAANALSRNYAQAVQALLAQAGVTAGDVRALGAHGQTVRHRPGEFDGTGYTLQLLNGALLAQLTGIDTICDFRTRDLALGGQGAPLVPAFHAALFHQAGTEQAILNLGGIGNLTLLFANGTVLGFDCGPGNCLLDLWCERHLGQPYDAGGAWAATGRPDPELLRQLLAEPFFGRIPPKSTGRDLFHAGWLEAALHATPGALHRPPQDIQATLVELTAVSASSALRQHHPAATRLLVCGGGAYNPRLMAAIAHHLPGVDVLDTSSAGLPPLQVEASAFAWMARAHHLGIPANLPAVTGASEQSVLGACYPACP